MTSRNARQKRNRRSRRRQYRHNKAQRMALAKALPFATINDIDFYNTIEFPLVPDFNTIQWPDTYLLPYRCFMEDEELNEDDIPGYRGLNSETSCSTPEVVFCNEESPFPFANISDTSMRLLFQPQNPRKLLTSHCYSRPNSVTDIVKRLTGGERLESEFCQRCRRPVYIAERVASDSKVFHLACFRCKNCRNRLCAGRWSSREGAFFCFPCDKRRVPCLARG